MMLVGLSGAKQWNAGVTGVQHVRERPVIAMCRCMRSGARRCVAQRGHASMPTPAASGPTSEPLCDQAVQLKVTALEGIARVSRPNVFCIRGMMLTSGHRRCFAARILLDV